MATNNETQNEKQLNNNKKKPAWRRSVSLWSNEATDTQTRNNESYEQARTGEKDIQHWLNNRKKNPH